MLLSIDLDRAGFVAEELRRQHTAFADVSGRLSGAENQCGDASLLAAVRVPFDEFVDETQRLGSVVAEYVDLTRNADRLHPTDLAQRLDALESKLAQLALALGDGFGAAGSKWEMQAFGNALRAEKSSDAETVLRWMESSGEDRLTLDEFGDLVDDEDVPEYVRAAIATIMGDEALHALMLRADEILNIRYPRPEDDTQPIFLTAAVFELMVASEVVSRGLADIGTYQQFDQAKNGELDDRISSEDVDIIAGDASLSQELRQLAEMLQDQNVFWMLDTAAAIPLTWDELRLDDRISYADVAATAVNLQAFRGQPEAAREFVRGLESVNEHRDGSGGYLPIYAFGDSGVRELAETALGDDLSLSEQVDLVAHLPESPGGVRNLAITEYYRRLGAELDQIFNPDSEGGVLSLDAEGSTGANWFMHGAWASASVRTVLVDNHGWGPISAGWDARQEMADGNQLLFHSLAPVAAEFIEAFPPGSEPTTEQIVEFFERQKRADGQPMLEDGDRQMRDGFVLMLDAMTDPDPVTRQQTMLKANLLLGVHEQALVDPYVDRALDQGWDDDFRVVFDPFDQPFSNSQIDPNLGGYEFDADEPLPTRHSHPDHVIGVDLTTTLNPANTTIVEINGTTFDLGGAGNGDVDLTPLEGWDDVPNGWEVDSQDIDPAVWFDEHGGPTWVLDGDEPRLVEGTSNGLPPEGYDELVGVEASDWANYNDRMWTIANAFQQAHTLPGAAGVPGNGFDTADLSFLPDAPS